MVSNINRVRQVHSNLLSNACKPTRKGRRTVDIDT